MTRNRPSPINYDSGITFSGSVDDVWHDGNTFYKRKIGDAKMEQLYNIDILFENELKMGEKARTTAVFFPLRANETKPVYVKVGMSYKP